MKLSNKVDSLRERVLVFGGPKSGKTELAGKLAEKFNVKLFDLENGYKTLRKLPADWQDRIEVFSIPDTKVFPVAIETMLKVITGSPVDFCNLHGKVNCGICKKDNRPFEHVELNALGPDDIVVVDSGTQLALSAMSHIKSKDDELDKPSWDDFAKQGFLMDKFLSQCQQAKFNLVFITHEVETELENGGKKLVPVAGTREFSRNTAKYFDHVIYCELKNKKHAFGSATNYAMSVLTGSRSDVAIESLGVPSLLPFFRHEVARDTKPERQTVTAVAEQPANSTAVEDNTAAASEAKVVDIAPVPIPKKEETMSERLARVRAERAGKK